MLVLRTTIVTAALAWLLGAAPAPGLTLPFGCITQNLAVDCAIGEAQLTVEVTDPGTNVVRFQFHNAGPAASSITDVYFDDAEDGALFRLSLIFDQAPLVDFEPGATPRNLPGASQASPPFVTTDGFSADSESPVQPRGVNPGETLGILFALRSGASFQDVLAHLDDGSLRIGIHVQGFAGGGSESFVSLPGPAGPNVPEPGAAGLVALGLLALAARQRSARRRSSSRRTASTSSSGGRRTRATSSAV
jgi:hypothetical protein